MHIERGGPAAMRVAWFILLLSLPLAGVNLPSIAAAQPEPAATAQQSTPSPSAPDGKPEPGPPAPKNVERIKPGDAIGVLGKQAVGPSGEDMGQLVEVLVDEAGRPVAAVIDFGGFLGVGSRKIAVDWRLLEFKPGDPKRQVLLRLDRAALQAAPEYKAPVNPSQPIDMLGPPPSAGTPAPSNAER
ncbi:MAG TPA: PRC-barrel domain-containing protein [Stellaceae bacterium]